MTINYDAELPLAIQAEMACEVCRRIEAMKKNAWLRPLLREADQEYFKMMFEKQFLRAKLVEALWAVEEALDKEG